MLPWRCGQKPATKRAGIATKQLAFPKQGVKRVFPAVLRTFSYLLILQDESGLSTFQTSDLWWVLKTFITALIVGQGLVPLPMFITKAEDIQSLSSFNSSLTLTIIALLPFNNVDITQNSVGG